MEYAFLIAYTTAAFGIHGGEGITGINRQVRNTLCALPFAFTAFMVWHLPLMALFAFALAYGGVSLGFDGTSRLRLVLKGLITMPPFGAVLLPMAYWIGYSTRWTNVLAEYLSGTFYGIALALIWRFYGHLY